MQSKSTITVLLAHFDDLFAAGLGAVLRTDPGIEVVARNVSHARIPVVLRAHHPDVAILDADALLQPAQVRDLGLGEPHTRLVLFAHDAKASSAPLLAFGASVCLGRDAQSRDVLNAVHLAARGLQLSERAIPTDSGHHPSSTQRLTPREAELLPLLQHGDSNAQIALTLGVGVETVRTHAHNLYGKLGVASRRELTAQPRGPGPARDAGTEAARTDAPSRAPGTRGRGPRGRRGHGLRC